MTAPRVSEHEEQAAFVDFVLQAYRMRDDFKRRLFFAVPNGAVLAGRGGRQARKLKREGMTNGVADLLYLQPRGPYNYLAIEMKRPARRKEKDGGLSPEQVEFLAEAAGAGACVDVCYSTEHAIEVFSNYMSLEVQSDKKEDEQTGADGADGTAVLAEPVQAVPDEPKVHSSKV